MMVRGLQIQMVSQQVKYKSATVMMKVGQRVITQKKKRATIKKVLINQRKGLEMARQSQHPSLRKKAKRMLNLLLITKVSIINLFYTI